FEAQEHHWLSFGQILGLLPLQRVPGRLPLISVVFNLDPGLVPNLAFPGLEVDTFVHARAFDSYELFVNASQRAGEIVLEAQYAADLFEEGTVVAWLNALERMLRGLVRDSGQLARASASWSDSDGMARLVSRGANTPIHHGFVDDLLREGAWD